jgi:NAD(P)-dependent dehydrogenase (short-subunit alcohol dehydrogenase family)
MAVNAWFCRPVWSRRCPGPDRGTDGGPIWRLDLLVNNAGLTITDPCSIWPADKLNYLINLNFRGYFLAAQAATRVMRDQKIKGNVINITSSRGERAYPGDAIYGGLKAGMNRAIQSMALDLAPYGIRINNVAPGATRVRDSQPSDRFYDGLAPRIPLGRIGTPEDMGERSLAGIR